MTDVRAGPTPTNFPPHAAARRLGRLFRGRDAAGGPAVRFLVAGVGNTILGFLLFRLFLWLLGGRSGLAWIAQATSAPICVAISYAVNRNWTFRSGGAHGRQLPRFVLAHLGSVVVSSGVIHVGVTIAHLSATVAWVLATCVTTLVNFLVQRHWVFAVRMDGASAQS